MMRFVTVVVLGGSLAWTVGCERVQQLAGPPVHQGCGDTICSADEHPGVCPVDCPLDECGNHACELYETMTNCPEDCPRTVCGNGDCEPGEDPQACLADCPWYTCGNGVCDPVDENGEPLETTDNCPEDCFSGYCGNGQCDPMETSADCPQDCEPTTKVDLLFVIDNSAHMGEEQRQLIDDFPELYEQARGPHRRPPDLHIGVISTDLGTAPHDLEQCATGGDQGHMLDLHGVLYGGAPYLVDVRPESCDEARSADSTCGDTNCVAAHCAHEPGTELELDEYGCPRCRNFAGEVPDAFASLADLGTTGCGFEQPLEALHQALNENPHNAGFLRGHAQLTMVILSDEDDCSAAGGQLFDPSQTSMDSPLGPLTSYRCFEFGVVCSQNQRDVVGPRSNCVPREDPGALIHPVSRYTSFIEGLKTGPGQLVVAAIVGPVVNNAVVVNMDSDSHPSVQPSCLSGSDGAIPAIRSRAFVRHFNSIFAMDLWAFQSICAEDYILPLSKVGNIIGARLAY
jgi:hypothetical protein